MTLEEAFEILSATLDEPGDSLDRSERVVQAFRDVDLAAAESKAREAHPERAKPPRGQTLSEAMRAFVKMPEFQAMAPTQRDMAFLKFQRSLGD